MQTGIFKIFFCKFVIIVEKKAERLVPVYILYGTSTFICIKFIV